MTTELDALAWKMRFVHKLGQLLPTMPFDEVVEWASKTYADASNLAPAEAAEIFSKAIPPEEVGEPGD